VQELIAEHSLEVVQAYMRFIQANAGAAQALQCAGVHICITWKHLGAPHLTAAGRISLFCFCSPIS
jgi:hypothetical protein